VNSVTTERFRKSFDSLPIRIKDKARKSYELWKSEPFHPSLNFKQVHISQPIYSVRIGFSFRALGIKDGETVVWFWIGSHEDYNNLISQI
jgi:hypothetical protein